MRVLLLGSGGREHALAWKLRRSPSVSELIVAPGNGGTAALAENVAIRADDIPAALALARSRGVDLTVVGPEAPLAAGLVDAFAAAGLLAWGPTRDAAALETSKAFAKDFMARHGIPSPTHRTFTDYDAARAYVGSLPVAPVIKADGLAAGKGVIVPATHSEAVAALHRMLVDGEFGASGRTVVVEQRLVGQEVSLLAFSDGSTVAPLLPVQDHKRALDGDAGPNTGGMGAYAPAPILTAPLCAEAMERVLQPTVRGMAAEGRPYRGIIYAGLMLTPEGLKALEFNCRFGDPETQVLLPLLETDLALVLKQCAEGNMDSDLVRWSEGTCASVVMASGGYPGHYCTGYPIAGIAAAERLGCVVFHAGTAWRDGELVTSGGRVVNVTATGADLRQAIERAYAGVRAIHFQDAHYRTDIGAQALAPASR